MYHFDVFNVADIYTRHHWNLDSQPLMQFTGLKDKNGKDVYEGDIVSFPEEPKYKQLWRVIFQDGAFAFTDGIGVRFLISQKNIYRDLLQKISWPAVENGEVIGNSYDNPELITARS